MQDHATRESKEEIIYEYGVSFPLRLTLEWCEGLPDSIIWTILYKQHSNDQQKAVWSVDGSSKVNRQQPVWKPPL